VVLVSKFKLFEFLVVLRESEEFEVGVLMVVEKKITLKQRVRRK
jgi:hypothetical protein